MRKIASILLLFLLVGCQDKEFNLYPESHYIYYTTTDGNPISYQGSYLSNTYDNGQGILAFRSPVSSIDSFQNLGNLKSITIPDSVTSIGDAAFSGCSSLTSVTIPDSVTSIGDGAFQACSSLTSITIPDSVTSIGEFAFSCCTSLTRVTIPNSVTSIESRAFYYCTGELIVNSKTIAMQHDGAWLDDSNFTKLTIGGGITTIGKVFARCKTLTSVTIPDSVTEIAAGAFAKCSGLKSFYGKFASKDHRCLILQGTLHSFAPAGLTEYTIPNSVTSVGEYVFCENPSLRSITIPDSVTSIAHEAFCGCENLTNVTMGNSVASIGDAAFGYCTSLTSITIPDSVTSIGGYAFFCCHSLTSVSIPDGVTEIGEAAFYHCYNLAAFYGKFASLDNRCLVYDGWLISFAPAGLTDYTIPDSVTTIAEEAFCGCENLINVTMGNSVTSIKEYAFCECPLLTSVTIPDSVTEIGNYAFADCRSLTSVYCKPTTPPVMGNDVFDDSAPGMKIYVLVGCLNAYRRTSGWSNYSSYITEIPYTPTECTSLTITADNVSWNETSTTIYYTAITNGTSQLFNEPLTGVRIAGTVQSDEFPQNTSETTAVERTISYTYMGQTATTTITQAKKKSKSYIVSLNGQWRFSSSVSNPNSSIYEGVYESYSNYGVNNSEAWMYINIDGYDTFTIYVRSYAESNYDFVTVYNLDSTYSVKMTTKSNQNSGTSISDYTAVTFSNIDGGAHLIAICYSKDSSQNSGADRGYVLIPKNQ